MSTHVSTMLNTTMYYVRNQGYTKLPIVRNDWQQNGHWPANSVSYTLVGVTVILKKTKPKGSAITKPTKSGLLPRYNNTVPTTKRLCMNGEEIITTNAGR